MWDIYLLLLKSELCGENLSVLFICGLKTSFSGKLVKYLQKNQSKMGRGFRELPTVHHCEAGSGLNSERLVCSMLDSFLHKNEKSMKYHTLQEHQKFRTYALISITSDTIYNYFWSTILTYQLEYVACIICVLM